MRHLTFLSEREKVMLAGGAIVLLVVLGTTYIFKPIQAKIQEKETMLAEKTTRLAELEPWRGTPGLLRKTLTEKENRYRELAQEMPPNPEMDWFLTQLEGEIKGQVGGIAHLTGVAVESLESIRPEAQKNAASQAKSNKSKEEAEGTFRMMGVNITLSGSYNQVKNFLVQLDQLPRLQKVTSLNLLPRTKGVMGAGNLTASLQLQFYLGPTSGVAPAEWLKAMPSSSDRDPFSLTKR